MSFKNLIAVLIVILFTNACSNTNKIIYKTANLPSEEVTGKVIDNYSKKPVSGARVWIEGTTIAVESKEDGEFLLSVPPGYYEVIVEHSAYKTAEQELVLTPNTVSSLNIEVIKEYQESESTGASTVSNSIQLQSNATGQVADKKQDFFNYYISETENCSVLNPEVISLNDIDNDKDVIRVSAPVELKVLNEELGYKITVNLKQYIAKKYNGILGLDMDADYLFEELKPKDAEQEKEWIRNREKAFEGSLRHFLIALASEKSLYYFGYQTFSGTFVNNVSSMAYTETQTGDIEVTKEEILNRQIPWENVLQFEEELRVEYLDKGNEDPYHIMGLDMYPYKTSWLSLNTDQLKFTKNGTIEDQSNIQITGAWRYTPVCKMLPENYLPQAKIDKES